MNDEHNDANAEADEPREFRQIQRARVVDILDELKALHERLSEYYRQAGAKAFDERAALLLQYLESHEQYVRNALEEYEEDAKQPILESWFRYAQNIPVDQLMERVESLQPNVTADEVAKLTAEISDFLIGACESIAELSTVREVREALSDLRDMEERAKIRALRSADEHMN